MNGVNTSTPMSSDAYLAFERAAEASGVKHEYVDGFVYAMAGASRRHAAIVRQLTLALGPAANRQGCDLYTNDVKVRIAEANCYYYPDVVVTCDRGDQDPYVVERPTVIVEVLSPTTASTDRREKLINYRKMPSLTDILLVDPETATITHHRRGVEAGDDWAVQVVAGESAIDLVWAGARLNTETVFVS